jgi:hypothetical protein
MTDTIIKSVTIEYFEEIEDDGSLLSGMIGAYTRHIRVVTTTSDYTSGGQRGEPTVSVTYETL